MWFLYPCTLSTFKCSRLLNSTGNINNVYILLMRYIKLNPFNSVLLSEENTAWRNRPDDCSFRGVLTLPLSFLEIKM